MTKPFAFWTDQDICDWFDGLDEAYVRSLIDLHDDHGITPRKAFHYVFGALDSQHCTCQACKLSLSPAPAQERQSESVAAPTEVGQGQGTSLELVGEPPRNKAIHQHSKGDAFFVGLPFGTEVHEITKGLLSTSGGAFSHDDSNLLDDKECSRRINEFVNSSYFQSLAKISQRVFEICAQENISIVELVTADLMDKEGRGQ